MGYEIYREEKGKDYGIHSFAYRKKTKQQKTPTRVRLVRAVLFLRFTA